MEINENAHVSKRARRENRTRPPAPASLPGTGKATEDQVCMRGIVPQRLDKVGTRIEEIAGTGGHDSLGG
jgi:hypothetical protein